GVGPGHTSRRLAGFRAHGRARGRVLRRGRAHHRPLSVRRRPGLPNDHGARLGIGSRRPPRRLRLASPRTGVIDAATEAALTVLFASIAGGVTNSVAIWMLFHPYEPPRVFGRPLRAFQGAIPKNKARLAAAVGRAVGTRLLTAEDLARTMSEPAFRAAFDERLAAFIRGE